VARSGGDSNRPLFINRFPKKKRDADKVDIKKNIRDRIMRQTCGMTMVETLLVVGLMSMIGLAAYQALSNGLKVWAFSRHIGPEQEIMISLDKMTVDLKNSFVLSGMKFQGTEQRLSFPTMVYGLQDRRKRKVDSEYLTQMGYVEYAFDPLNSALVRRQANYAQAVREKFERPQVLAQGIRLLRFRYYYAQGKQVDFFSDTDQGRPVAVEVTFEFNDRTGQPQEMKRFVYLPVRG